jgi:hypothetical protein
MTDPSGLSKECFLKNTVCFLESPTFQLFSYRIVISPSRIPSVRVSHLRKQYSYEFPVNVVPIGAFELPKAEVSKKKIPGTEK